MFAIIKVGACQYKVAEGDVIRPNRMKVAEGDKVTLDQVLFYANGSDVRVGQPYLKDVEVRADVVGEDLGDKVVAFKYKLRKGYERKVGHRQKQTLLSIAKIAAK